MADAARSCRGVPTPPGRIFYQGGVKVVLQSRVWASWGSQHSAKPS